MLLLIIAFPAANLIFAASTYCLGQSLNDLELQGVAKVRFDQAHEVARQIQEQFTESRFGSFARWINCPNIEISYGKGVPTTNGTDDYVTVETTIVAKPFILLPLSAKTPQIPGLTADAAFHIPGSRPLENPSYATAHATYQ
jgi:hypothetical protein